MQLIRPQKVNRWYKKITSLVLSLCWYFSETLVNSLRQISTRITYSRTSLSRKKLKLKEQRKTSEIVQFFKLQTVDIIRTVVQKLSEKVHVYII